VTLPSQRHAIRAASWALGVLLVLGVLSSAAFTGAQPRTAPRGKPRPTKPHKPVESADAGAEPPRAHLDGGEGAVTQKTTDGGTRVFRFGEMEIEGRLKNPQLVFFLRRVRAEFAAGDLGHRSFMRELGETKLDPNF
jgi:hypothetical protein